MPKQPLHLISLRFPHFNPESGRGFCALDPDTALAIAYIDNTGQEPKNFPEVSQAGQQFLFNKRKKGWEKVIEAADLNSEHGMVRKNRRTRSKKIR